MELKKSKVKENSEITYKDCPWYMEIIDRCKIPSCKDRYLPCKSKEKSEMQDFCIWLTKFLTPDENPNRSKAVQLELFNVDNHIDGLYDLGSESELAPISYLEDLFEKAYETIRKRKEKGKEKEQ
jgi:hypothetical protein